MDKTKPVTMDSLMVIDDAVENLLSPKIQKEIATCFEAEVLEIIFKEIGDDVFALLVDESSDVTKKEQMAIVFRYVNKNGLVKESLVDTHPVTLLVLARSPDLYSVAFGIANFFSVLDEGCRIIICNQLTIFKLLWTLSYK
ncbi:zinc finger MYM-type protein 1-like protein [Tanacetum coccineum]